MGGLKLGIGGKIWSLVGLMVVGLTLLVAEGLLSTRRTMMEDRQQALRQIIESAQSVVANYRTRAAKGEITEERYRTYLAVLTEAEAAEEEAQRRFPKKERKS